VTVSDREGRSDMPKAKAHEVAVELRRIAPQRIVNLYCQIGFTDEQYKLIEAQAAKELRTVTSWVKQRLALGLTMTGSTVADKVMAEKFSKVTL